MSARAHRMQWREWAAMLAVLAIALGPLALAVQRGLGAADKVAVAAGLAPPALCLPGGGNPDKPSGGPDCDHCTPPQVFTLAAVGPVSAPAPRVSGISPQASRGHTVHFPRAPPARGPPSA